MKVKILIADDHALVREGLKMILESHSDMQVVGEAGDGRDALAQAEALRPDIILMDIAMPNLNGIEATSMIRERLPMVKIIILSMHYTKEHVFRAMQAGARAYLLKESVGTSVVMAIKAVMKGRIYFGKGVDDPQKMHFGSSALSQSPIDGLSKRELEILQLVVEGNTSAKIAELLSLSPKSVETYRSRLMLKLGINNIPSLVKFALQHGIIHAE